MERTRGDQGLVLYRSSSRCLDLSRDLSRQVHLLECGVLVERVNGDLI